MLVYLGLSVYLIILILVLLRQKQVGVIWGSSPYVTKFGARLNEFVCRFQGYKTKLNMVDGYYVLEYWLKEEEPLLGIGDLVG